MTQKSRSLFDWNIVGPAIGDAFKKLNPRLMVKNPVMFVTMVGAALTTVGIFTSESGLRGFVTQLAIWLWFTVLFANFAEAMAEGRGKAQAATLRKARTDDNGPSPAEWSRGSKFQLRYCKKATSWFAKREMLSRQTET